MNESNNKASTQDAATPIRFVAPQAGDALVWLAAGWRIFWRNPLTVMSAAITCVLLPLLLMSLLRSDIAAILSMLLLPGLVAGAYFVAHLVEQGQRPMPHTVFKPFFFLPWAQTGARFRAVCWSGLLFTLLLLLLSWATQSLLADAFVDLQAWMQQSNAAVQERNALGQQLLLKHPNLFWVSVAVTVTMAALFLLATRAAALSFCFGLPVVKAWFYSSYSLFKSIPAMLLFLLLVLLGFLGISLLGLIHPFVYTMGFLVALGVLCAALGASFTRSFPPPNSSERV